MLVDVHREDGGEKHMQAMLQGEPWRFPLYLLADDEPLECSFRMQGPRPVQLIDADDHQLFRVHAGDRIALRPDSDGE